MTLLPSNATRLERALEAAAAARIDALNAPIDTLWNAQRCPLPLLPWLAWALSVDHWDEGWTEEQKRAVVERSAKIHRLKGTRGSVEVALAALGFRADLTEWWEPGGSGVPHTVRIDAYGQDVFAAGLTLDARLLASVSRLIDTVKPVHVHYSLRLGRSFSHDRIPRAAMLARRRVTAEGAITTEPRELVVDRVPRAALGARYAARMDGTPAAEPRTISTDAVARQHLAVRAIRSSTTAPTINMEAAYVA